MTLEAARDRRVVGIAGAGARIDDDVDGGQFMLVVSKRFANQPLQAITSNGAADDSGGNRQPQSRLGAAVAANEDCEQGIGETSRILINAIEIRFGVKTLRRSERPSGSRQVRMRTRPNGRRVRPSGACGLSHDGERGLAGPHALPCAHEIRACVCDESCSAGKCASC